MIDQTPDLDGILAKVQKMLNVQGRTPEEAAAFVERAHAILAQYDLTIESVHNLKADSRTSVRKTDSGTRTTEGKPDGWKADILEAVAAAFECRVVWGYESEETKSGRYRNVKVGNLVGFGHDVEAAGYANSFVVNEVIRLSKEYSRPMWDTIKADAARFGSSIHDAEKRYVRIYERHPLKAELFFVRGAAETVGAALRADARRRKDEAIRTANPNALVIAKAEEVDDFLYRESHDGLSKAEYKAKMDGWAQEKGYDDYAAYNSAMVARWSEANPEKPLSPSERRRREEAEARRQQRSSDAYWRRMDREEAKKDHDALRAGREAGGTIKIRLGVKPGETTGGLNG